MDIISRTLEVVEDRRRLDAFSQTRTAAPLDDVKSWVASWGSTNELPRPAPRKIGYSDAAESVGRISEA